MSQQIGMQMPGARGKRTATPDVYTALALFAVLALGAACALLFLAGSKVGVDGSPFGIQDPDRIQLPSN